MAINDEVNFNSIDIGIWRLCHSILSIQLFIQLNDKWLLVYFSFVDELSAPIFLESAYINRYILVVVPMERMAVLKHPAAENMLSEISPDVCNLMIAFTIVENHPYNQNPSQCNFEIATSCYHAGIKKIVPAQSSQQDSHCPVTEQVESSTKIPWFWTV